jgi:hypothetical protein
VSPGIENKVQNQIGHIYISKLLRKSLLVVCNKRGADTASDHHLLMGIIRFSIKRHKKYHTCRRKYNLMKMKVADKQNSLKGEL